MINYFRSTDENFNNFIEESIPEFIEFDSINKKINLKKPNKQIYGKIGIMYKSFQNDKFSVLLIPLAIKQQPIALMRD